MEIVHLLFGGNRGDREGVQEEAVDRVGAKCGRIVARSSLYETEPWGFSDSVPFLNQVVAITSSLSPFAVLDTLKDIEEAMGRVRSDSSAPRFESRLLDIDILLFGERMMDEEGLVIPHPRLHLRRFTLVPLCEVAPERVHPRFGKTVAELLAACPDPLRVEKWGDPWPWRSTILP